MKIMFLRAKLILQSIRLITSHCLSYMGRERERRERDKNILTRLGVIFAQHTQEPMAS